MKTIRDMTEWLWSHRDDGAIKVVTGLRGTGKSSALAAYRARLEESGVPPTNIITLDFNSSIYRQLRTTKDILACVDAYTLEDDRYYVFIDEPLDAEGFGSLADALRSRTNLDIVVVSSSAAVLEGASGSVRSYGVRRSADDFPHLAELGGNKVAANEYLAGLWNTIFLRDVLTLDKAIDCRLMEHIAEYLALHLGESVSLRQIAVGAAEMAGGRVPAASTVSEYLNTLFFSHVFAKVPRFDIFSREVMSRGYSVFSPCPGLLQRRFGTVASGNSFRNLVWTCLCRSWNEVFMGRTPNAEVDFVVRSDRRYAYYQAVDGISTRKDLDRVLAPLTDIPDSFPKVVVTMKPSAFQAPKGIELVSFEAFARREDRP